MVLGKTKPGYVLSLKHGLDVPQFSTHTCVQMHKRTHIQPFNFSNGNVMWCLLTESIIKMVKFFLLYHVFAKNYHTNEFPYPPTILHTRLNIPRSLQTLFMWFHFICFSILCHTLDLDRYPRVMIKIRGSKLNTEIMS